MKKHGLAAVAILFLTASLQFILPAGNGERNGKSSHRNQSTSINLAKPDATTQARINESYGKLPMSFEINQGQTDRQVQFFSRGSGYNLFLTQTEAVLQFHRKSTEKARVNRETDTFPPAFIHPQAGFPKGDPPSPNPASSENSVMDTEASAVVRMKLLGSNPTAPVKGAEMLPGKSNYFIGNDKKNWRTNVAQYAKVRYENVYAGVDLVYYGNQRQLEYDIIVSPGADPGIIKLGFEGIEKLSINEMGELVLKTGDGEIKQHKPKIYQEQTGVRTEIVGNYVLESETAVGFEVAAYDTNRPLIIDPVLVYSTYLGGTNDEGNGIAVDMDGNAYVTGYTEFGDFPTTLDAFQLGSGGNQDAFVTKLNATGNALVYSTYLGGSSFDYGYGIAVDSDHQVYVTGYTQSSNFPITNSSFQPTPGGNYDTFVTQLTDDGSGLVYSTYLGGTVSDYGFGIAVDIAGNAYVTGYTYSNNFPTTTNAFQPHNSADDGSYDAFVTKLNLDGTALDYSTYLGGHDYDVGNGIAVDTAGNAYVTGVTLSIDFPTTLGSFQFSKPGGYDAFVTKLNGAGNALVYSTYLGSGFVDYGNGIAVDTSRCAYVTGLTLSGDFPTTPDSFQTDYHYGQDAFVTKLNADGTALDYSTYLGGNTSDVGNGIAVDTLGNAYVTGMTYSIDFPTTNPTIQSELSDSGNIARPDIFVTQLSTAGNALVFSTYLGGNGDDVGRAIAMDNSAIYVAGLSRYSTNFPVVNPFQSTNHGIANVVVFKINVGCSTITGTLSGGGTICAGTSSTVIVTVAGGTAPYTVTLNNGGGMQTGSSPLSFEVFPGSTTTYSVESGTDALNCPITGSGSATVTVNPPPTVSAGPDQIICSGQIVHLAGSFGGSATGAHWVGGGGTFDQDAYDVNAVYYPSPTEYQAGTVTLYLEAVGPCPGANDSMTITINKCIALMVADTMNSRIQGFDGTVWSVIGTGIPGSGAGQFIRPEAVTFNSNVQRIYVADTGNNRIQWSTDGGINWAVFAGNGTGLNQVKAPQGVALDSAGNLYVSDTGNGRVLRFSGGIPGNGFVIASSGSGSGQVKGPMGLVIDSSFRLFVTDHLNSRVLRINNANAVNSNASGTIIATAGTALNKVMNPQGITIYGVNLYVADTGNNRILRWVYTNPSSNPTAMALSGGGLGQVGKAEGVTITKFVTGPYSGGVMLIVGDTANNRIQGRFIQTGGWQLIGAPDNLGGGIGQFRTPSKIR